MEFTVKGQPIGKPRMTRRDKWARRDCVVAYRAWADRARAALAQAGGLPADVRRVEAVAYFAIPSGWPRADRALAAGEPHRTKPDVDNVAKALLDALLERDQVVSDLRISKRWDDGRGPCLEVILA